MKKTILILVCWFASIPLLAAEKPNILWIFAEDTSPWMGCYGDKVNEGKTPNIDSIANRGVIFKRAFVPAPVCSACRSAMIVGQSQIRFGAHEHRSSRGPAKIYLPKGYKLIPQIMRENGYETFNIGKTDYNFEWDEKAVYSLKPKGKNPFTELKAKQPFFGQIQTKGGKHNTTKFPASRKASPDEVTVPKDYPQNDIQKEVVAQHYDAIRKDDDYIGEILKNLKASGMADNTIVVYFSDHGANNLLRHKQMTTEGGLHVPFMVMGPEKYVPKKQVRNDLINTLDLTATTLAWAGVELPSWYEGQNLFAKDFKERTFIGSGKDRLDHTIDRVRTVRTDRYRYVRNFKFDRILLQPQYRDKKPYTQNMHMLYKEGKLSADLKRIYFGERPVEELYDIIKDPAMVHNLADDATHSKSLSKLRSLMDNWLAKGDKGAGEESIEALKTNGEGTKWGEGVNVEYEEYRTDSDGDGLSDKWETLNNRDPKDGLLTFDFNCGAWQNEGWAISGSKSNIAGFLGFLDFHVESDSVELARHGLNVSSNPDDKSFEVVLKTSNDLKLSLSANGQKLGTSKVKAGNFQKVLISLAGNKSWQGSIKSLKLNVSASPGTIVEVDSLKVIR
ncbi:MAG: sulfatase-like hydrolase/transferase [Lentisphaeraceae bacterium]|nr:sulfatase-like hydrolase/transferase [Lentisphaeraceae bacterium]